ncbi:MAG: DUF58 domain-containing protein [Chitinophagaceae bacterium]
MLGNAVLFLAAYFFPVLVTPAYALMVLWILFTLCDLILLFGRSRGISAQRSNVQAFSLGDENEMSIELRNDFPFAGSLQVIDELPVQFQNRDFRIQFTVPAGTVFRHSYQLRPQSRGLYSFGHILVYAESPLHLLRRRFVCGEQADVKVYPSFLKLRQYQLMALSDSNAAGAKKMRRLGHSLEFEQIKEYVTGDDIRSMNWKATARRGTAMLNTYTDTRQQQIYCIIDKGRTMKMPFDGLSLLDYAINASLALSYVTLHKQDNAGLITFAGDQVEVVPADRRNKQFVVLREALYRQETDFRESDFEQLQQQVARKINQRSLLLLFTNFETMASLERQLPYLRQMARRHLLCVIFFENTAVHQLSRQDAKTLKQIYTQTIAARFDYEKRQIVRELRKHGILAVLSKPKDLTVNVINKYLELKSRQMV